MKKLLSVLFVLFSVYVPVLSQSYYITEEQLTELENQSKEQKALIQKLDKELLTQTILVQDLQNQLQKAQEQVENSQKALNEAKISLNKSEIKNLVTNIAIGFACLCTGFAVGYFATNPP